MKILIIGANSFLGKNLSSFYKKKNFKITLCRTFSYSTKDDWIRDIIKKIKKTKPEIIFYCSAEQTLKDDQKNIKKIIFTNCETPCLIASKLYNYNFLNSVFVFFGTSWENNFEGKYFPINLYAASKKASEILLTHYALKGIKIINFKLFDTYGKNDYRKKFIYLLLNSIKNNIKIKTTKGLQEINLTEINDICKGIDLGINESKKWKYKKNGILKYYLGTKKVLTIKKLVRISEKILGKKSKIIFGGLDYRDREPMKTFKKFKTPKNWKPKNNIFDFIKLY